MPVSDITDEVIENMFNRVVQSHKDFVIEEGVAFNVIAMEYQRGGGGRKKRVSACVNVMENMKHDSNIVCPPMYSGDEMCLARCLTYGMIWHRNQGRNRAQDLRRLRDTMERWTWESHSVCVSRSGTPRARRARCTGKARSSRPPVFQERAQGGNDGAGCGAGEWPLHVHQERGTVLHQALLL